MIDPARSSGRITGIPIPLWLRLGPRRYSWGFCVVSRGLVVTFSEQADTLFKYLLSRRGKHKPSYAPSCHKTDLQGQNAKYSVEHST